MIGIYDFGPYEDRVKTLIEKYNCLSVERLHKEYKYLKTKAMKGKCEAVIIDRLEQEAKMLYFKSIKHYSFERKEEN